MNTTASPILTLTDCLSAMAPYAGGSVPLADDPERADWIRWIQLKQNEYAYRGKWRRLLQKKDLVINGTTVALPTNFFRPDGIYAMFLDGVDISETNSDIKVFVYTDLDTTSPTYGAWMAEFSESISDTASLWYFGAPGIPTELNDKLILPGDLILFGALTEYFRGAGTEGSQDDARNEAENRFQEYLSIENLPSKQELSSFATQVYVDRSADIRAQYTSRPGRNRT